MNPLHVASPKPVFQPTPPLSPNAGAQHLDEQPPVPRDVCVPASGGAWPASASPVAPPPASTGAATAQQAPLAHLQEACAAVRTSLLRTPSAQEMRAAKEHPTDIPTRSADICTLGGATAHRRYHEHRKSGQHLRAGLCLAGSTVGHGLTLVSFPLTLPLAGAHYLGMQALGRKAKGTSCSISRVRLDMVAADLLKMRHALREVCRAAPDWSENKTINKATFAQYLREAERALAHMYEDLSLEQDPKVSTNDLLHKHLRNTVSIWEHTQIREDAWGDKRAMDKLHPPRGEDFFDRMLSPRFFEDLGLATSTRSKVHSARVGAVV